MKTAKIVLLSATVAALVGCEKNTADTANPGDAAPAPAAETPAEAPVEAPAEGAAPAEGGGEAPAAPAEGEAPKA